MTYLSQQYAKLKNDDRAAVWLPSSDLCSLLAIQTSLSTAPLRGWGNESLHASQLPHLLTHDHRHTTNLHKHALCLHTCCTLGRRVARARVDLRFNERGPSGPSDFDAGVQGFETGSFRGLGVVRAMPFETSDESDAVQMLQRQTQVGEYYVIGAPDKPPPAGTFCSWDTIVYDEDSDTLVKISFVSVIDHLVQMLGGNAGAEAAVLMLLGLRQIPAAPAAIGQLATGLQPGNGQGAAADTSKLDEAVALINTVAGMSYYVAAIARGDVAAVDVTVGGGDLSTNAATRAFVNGTTIADVKRLAQKGVWFPAKIVLARPFIEHLSLSAIAAVAGADTGATLFGPSGKPRAYSTLDPAHVLPSGLICLCVCFLLGMMFTLAASLSFADMQLSANTSVKTIEGHCASFITVPNLPAPIFKMSPRLSAPVCRHHAFQGGGHQAAERFCDARRAPQRLHWRMRCQDVSF